MENKTFPNSFNEQHSEQQSMLGKQSENQVNNHLETPTTKNWLRRNWLNHLKVGEKITIGYMLSLGVAIAGTSTGILVGNRYQQAALERKLYAIGELTILSQLQAGVLQSRTHQQQLIPLSEFPEDFQDEYAHILAHADSIQNAWISLDEHLQVGQQTVSNNATPGTNLESQNDTDLIQFAQTYRGVDRQYLRELDKLVTQVDITNIETPKQLRQAQKQLLAFTNSDLAIEFDGISDALSGLIKNAQNSHNAASEASIKSEYLRNQIILLSMALSVCVAAILVLITSRAINHPLKVVEETATRVVETENFDLRTAVFTKDEVGSLAIALNQLIEWVSHKTQALETARDTLEKSVKERTQELNAIIDSLGNGLLVVSDQGAIVRINPTLKDLFELPGHKLENQPVQSFFEGRIIQLIQQSQTNPTERLTDELHLPNNRIGQAIVTAIVSEGNTDNAEKDTGRDLSQQVVGTVVLIRDITTEKAVDQMKTDFISTVSHELRTPLTSVLGFAKIIQKKLDKVLLPAVVSEEKKTKRAARQVTDNLKIIVSEGERLTALINDVLDIAKIEAGKIEWRMAQVSPAAVLEQAISATRVLAQKNGVILTPEIPPDLPTITADQDRIVQVLINLISNAIKFTKDGTVTCQIKLTEDELQMSVIDTGIGISEEDQPFVFEKFKQVGEIMTDKPQGTGLGLPICKQIIEHHQGRIWVESQLHMGSTFTVALPIKPPEKDYSKDYSKASSSNSDPTVEAIVSQIKANVQQTTPHKTGERKTILVVDDEINIRQLLRQELETEGYLVKEATDGVAALAMVKKIQPDLIITDVMMPRLDGFDLTAVLKTNPQTANIPTIILSIVEDKDRGIRLGVDRYLTKPINVGELLDSIDALLTNKTSRNKVLVVNRNTNDSKALAEMLLKKGYIVAEASSGKEGLDKARSIKPDMVIVEADLSEEQDIVKTLRFEKGLEELSVILVESIDDESIDNESG